MAVKHSEPEDGGVIFVAADGERVAGVEPAKTRVGFVNQLLEVEDLGKFAEVVTIFNANDVVKLLREMKPPLRVVEL